jgi:RND family efflux transporter MFP subunit
MTGKFWLLCLVLLIGCLARMGAAGPPAPGSEVIVLRRCSLEYERSSKLGASQAGVLRERLVREGDRVKAGQVLGRLDDRDLRAELAVRTEEAESDVIIRLAEAKTAHAKEKLRTSGALSRGGVVESESVRLHKLQVTTAELAIAEARHRRRLAELQREHTRALLQAREIVSPFDGVVTALYKAPGESVNLNEPVFRVVTVDRLRVTGYLDVTDAWGARAGRSVRVWAEVGGVRLPIAREVFTGRVVFVDAEVDEKTQTCKVIAEVSNRDGLLRAGLHARMEIHPGRQGGKAAVRAPGR